MIYLPKNISKGVINYFTSYIYRILQINILLNGDIIFTINHKFNLSSCQLDSIAAIPRPGPFEVPTVPLESFGTKVNSWPSKMPSSCAGSKHMRESIWIIPKCGLQKKQMAETANLYLIHILLDFLIRN